MDEESVCVPEISSSSNSAGISLIQVEDIDRNPENGLGTLEDQESDYEQLLEFRKKATVIIEEYFVTDQVELVANELRELDWPFYHYYFVKKLISTAMDRHDREKEMAAILVSTLYAEVIEPSAVYKGFSELVICVDDLAVDIPDVVDVLALFIARAVVDDILPPAFLRKHLDSLPGDSKGVEVIMKADKGYLSASLHTENILHRWGGSKSVRVEDVRIRINELLKEYVSCGDKTEAYRCIRDLNLPFYHHEIVKRALILAMERRSSVAKILDLLREAYEEGVINESQMSKGFGRLMDVIDDLSLDIPDAKKLLQSFIGNASSEGWLCASSLRSLSVQPQNLLEVDDEAAKIFKLRATSIIQEYFIMGDVLEVISSLQSEITAEEAQACNAIFVKRLITIAMGRKKREKEMASVLLTFLGFPCDDIMTGFLLLLESAEDTALDNPCVVEDLAMFLARAVVDEVLPPSLLDQVNITNDDTPDYNTVGNQALKMSLALLRAPRSGERILRCWGGGWEIEYIKEKIMKLLEEYDFGGDAQEAWQCIKDIGLPFFHHEVVKKALIILMEKGNKRIWELLQMCFTTGLITENQITKGFKRVGDCMDDLVLDIPNAKTQYIQCLERAMEEGMIEPCFDDGVNSENHPPSGAPSLD